VTCLSETSAEFEWVTHRYIADDKGSALSEERSSLSFISISL
jgi:hypothetical protein